MFDIFLVTNNFLWRSSSRWPCSSTPVTHFTSHLLPGSLVLLGCRSRQQEGGGNKCLVGGCCRSSCPLITEVYKLSSLWNRVSSSLSPLGTNTLMVSNWLIVSVHAYTETGWWLDGMWGLHEVNWRWCPAKPRPTNQRPQQLLWIWTVWLLEVVMKWWGLMSFYNNKFRNIATVYKIFKLLVLTWGGEWSCLFFLSDIKVSHMKQITWKCQLALTIPGLYFNFTFLGSLIYLLSYTLCVISLLY